MRPVDVQQIGNELALKWDDGTETFLPLERLRRACPCAGCQGERDVMGQLHRGPEQTLSATSFKLIQIVNVGGYALQPVWADGHASGIYPFAYLKRTGEG
jgi:DUF971 family protein